MLFADTSRDRLPLPPPLLDDCSSAAAGRVILPGAVALPLTAEGTGGGDTTGSAMSKLRCCPTFLWPRADSKTLSTFAEESSRGGAVTDMSPPPPTPPLPLPGRFR